MSKNDDRFLHEFRRKLIEKAGTDLNEARMVRFDKRTTSLAATDLGRVAAQYYIHHETILMWTKSLTRVMTDEDLLKVVSGSEEFQQLQVREDEMTELEDLMARSAPVRVGMGAENSQGKISFYPVMNLFPLKNSCVTDILLQAYISRARIETFSLVSDCSFVTQSAGRSVSLFFYCNLFL